jgi:hypothetical protein
MTRVAGDELDSDFDPDTDSDTDHPGKSLHDMLQIL